MSLIGSPAEQSRDSDFLSELPCGIPAVQRLSGRTVADTNEYEQGAKSNRLSLVLLVIERI